MSVSFYASVIWGFKVEFEDIVNEEKRFDEKTGEPYFIDVTDGQIAYLEGGFEFSKEESDDIHDEIGVNGLGVFTTTDREDFFIGLSIGKTRDIAYGQPPIKLNPEIPEDVLTFSKRHGVEPKMYLVPYCSY